MRNEKILTFVLASLTFLLYAPGIQWGLPEANTPETVHPWGDDELAPLHPVSQTMVYLTHSGLGDPQYPLFHNLLLTASYLPYVGIEYLRGRFRYTGGGYPHGFIDPVSAIPALVLIARGVSLLMGMGVVLIAYQIGLHLWDRRAGAMASLVILTSYPMFFYSKTSNVDVPALFWCSLMLLQFVRIQQQGLSAPRAITVGICAALAVATKDYQYAVVLALGLALGMQQFSAFRSLDPGEAKSRFTSILVGAASFFVVYLPASGFALWPRKFMSHVYFLTHGGRKLFYFSYPASLAGYGALLWDAIRLTARSLSWPLLLLAFVAIFHVAWREKQKLWILLPIPATFFLAFLPIRYMALRFIMIWVFLLALFAARGFFLGWESRRRPLRAAAGVFAAVGLAMGLVGGLDLDYAMIHDSRYEAARWMRDHVAPGSSVGFFGPPKRASVLPRLPDAVTPAAIAPAAEIDFPLVATDLVVLLASRDLTAHSLCSARTYAALVDGSLGYAEAARFQTRTLLDDHVAYFEVNPPIVIFSRRGSAPAGPAAPHENGAVHFPVPASPPPG